MLLTNKLSRRAVEIRRPDVGPYQHRSINRLRVNAAAEIEYSAIYEPSKPAANGERRSVLLKSDILLQQGQKVIIPK